MLVPSPSQRKFLEENTTRYQNQLTNDARDYLMGRGLEERTIEHFRYGVVDDPAPGHEYYKGKLAIPYLTPSGSVVSIRFRSLPPASKEYLTVKGDTTRIYNTADLELGTTAICVTEGEFDCAIAWQCGLPSIALPGAEAWKPLFARLLQQYEAVYILSDDDEAGRRFADTVSRDLDNARNVPMIGGDVNEFFLTNGIEALRRKVGAR